MSNAESPNKIINLYTLSEKSDDNKDKNNNDTDYLTTESNNNLYSPLFIKRPS